MLNFFNSDRNKLFKTFHKKTGIQLTEEPIINFPKAIEEQMEELHYLSQSKPKKAISPLLKLMKKYPQIPSIKNKLYVAYHYSNQPKKAKQILEQTLKEHPDYLFARTNKILLQNDEEEVKKLAHLLGEPREITSLLKQEVIHVNQFVNYQMAATTVDLALGEEEKAVNRLDTLMDIEAEEYFQEAIIKKILEFRLKKMDKFGTKRQEFTRSPKTIQKVPKWEPYSEMPSFHHPEVEAFYTHSIQNLPKETIANIMALPRQTLIEDLEIIVADAYKRWDIFKLNDYNENSYEFQIHAIYFLGALKAEESLTKVLDLFRMGEGFTDYWFADAIQELLLPPLYALGENHLDILFQFCLEENIYGFDKLMLTQVVEQVALHQVERREEVKEWIKKLFNHFLENEENENLMDTVFITSALNIIISNRMTDLIPIVEALFNKKWVDPMYWGPLEDIITRINSPADPRDLYPMPKDIFEYYSGEYRKRRAKPYVDEELKQKMNTLQPSKAEQKIQEAFMEVFTLASSPDDDDFDDFEDDDDFTYIDHKPIETVKRSTEKVGRNDPCPCGSGKKYKKCCGRK